MSAPELQAGHELCGSCWSALAESAWRAIRARAAQRKDRVSSAPAISRGHALTATLVSSGQRTAAHIDADRAMQYVKEIVKFGPRPIGSANHKKVEDYITSHLKGDRSRTTIHRRHARRQVSGAQHHRQISGNERRHHRDCQPLRYELPAAGYFVSWGRTMAHLRARCCWKLPINFAARTRDGYSVWLVWDDAEEAIESTGCGDRQLVWHAPSRGEVAGRRDAEEDQGVPAGRHDRRRGPEY